MSSVAGINDPAYRLQVVHRGGIPDMVRRAPISAKSYAFRGALESDAASNALSSSFDLGAAAAGRVVIVALGAQNDDPDPVVVANGVTLTKAVNTVLGPTTGIYAGVVAAGSGAQTVSVTWTSAAFEWKFMAVWTALGLSSAVPKQAVSQPNGAADLVIPVDAGDFLFYIGHIGSQAAGNVSGSTQAPARQAQITGTGTHGFSADWTIAASNASFSIHDAINGFLKAAATFA